MTIADTNFQLAITIYRHKQRSAYAARSAALGLTGYGPTEEAACESLSQLVGKFVAAYDERGQLERRLMEAGVIPHPEIEASWDSIRHETQMVVV